jgi:hypothetical protein
MASQGDVLWRTEHRETLGHTPPRACWRSPRGKHLALSKRFAISAGIAPRGRLTLQTDASALTEHGWSTFGERQQHSPTGRMLAVTAKLGEAARLAATIAAKRRVQVGLQHRTLATRMSALRSCNNRMPDW